MKIWSPITWHFVILVVSDSQRKRQTRDIQYLKTRKTNKQNLPLIKQSKVYTDQTQSEMKICKREKESRHPDNEKELGLNWTHPTETQNQCKQSDSNTETRREENMWETQKQLEEVTDT